MDHRSVVNRAVRAAVLGHGRARVTNPAARPGESEPQQRAASCAPLPIITEYPVGRIVTCDHAIFTSVRSPTGEGYRVIAASGGVRREERTEITRRSPSHGGLTNSESNAIGLLTYRMASGRLCVSVCRYAGTEHTARGGRRVHTHVALLDDTIFAQFGHNHVRVMAAILQASPEPLTQSRPSLAELELKAPVDPYASFQLTGAQTSPQIQHLMQCVAAKKSFVLSACSSPWAMLETALDLLPFGLRKNRSLMAGLVYASARDVDVALLDELPRDAQRSLRGRNVTCQQAGGPEMPTHPDLTPWMSLVSARLEQNRSRELCRLIARLGSKANIDALNRLARLCLDLDSIDGLDETQRIALADSYRGRESTSDVERELVEQVRQRTQPRHSDTPSGE